MLVHGEVGQQAHGENNWIEKEHLNDQLSYNWGTLKGRKRYCANI
jgi:hypothetical protein